MKAFVANTDVEYRHLLDLSKGSGGLDDVDFWKPSGRANFGALAFGQPLVFQA